MSCQNCNSEVEGAFCSTCGAAQSAPPPTIDGNEDPGILVSTWHRSKVKLDELDDAAGKIRADLDVLADTLQETFGIVLQRVGNDPSPPVVNTPSTTPDEPASPAEDQPASVSPTPQSMSGAIRQHTRTGPMGHEDESPSAAEPSEPSAARVAAQKAYDGPPQTAIGTIEDDHEGKTDPVVDEVRKESGTDDIADSDRLAASVARTLGK